MNATGQLSDRQQIFVREYLIDLNATAAYKRAGYQSKGRAAENNAARLMGDDRVKAAVQAALAERSKRLQLTADDVLEEWSALAKSDIGDILDFTGTDPHLRPVNQIPAHARRAISGVKVRRYLEGHGDDARLVEVTEFKLWDKNRALDQMGKHHGLAKDVLEVTGKNGGELVVKMIGGKASMEDL